MTAEILAFFIKAPGTLPLYEAIEAAILHIGPETQIVVHKTQITFQSKHGFAFVSLPYRKVKGRPEVHVILTFGLPYRAQHPLVAITVEPYPNRWTHHAIIAKPDDLDAPLLALLQEAHAFAHR